MKIVRETVVYDGPGGPFEGVMAYDAGASGRQPGVLLLHNGLGQSAADAFRAEKIAALGYVAFAGDVFGQGKRKAPGSSDILEYMAPLQADRGLLLDRAAAALGVLQRCDRAQPDRIAAVGYCFGGKCVLDMARAGLAILGGVSVHGDYDPPDYATAAPIRTKLLVAHGWDDPIGPPEKLVALAHELTASGADWQIHCYGHAGHAFTDQSATELGLPGIAYEERADRRSWRAMVDFLAEALA